MPAFVTLLLDFESRSRADLKRIGGRNYWADATTEPLCCVWHDTDTGVTDVWLPGDPTPAPLRAGATPAAHNAMGFDRFGAIALGWCTLETEWIDTSELARRAGLPGALDALGTRWLGTSKDKSGNLFVKSLSRPSRAKARLGLLPDITPEVLGRVVPYCASDVEILEHGWPLLESWQALEPDVSWADRAVNDRGMAFDSQLARALLNADARLADAALTAAGRALGMPPERVREIARSTEQFTDFTGLPNAQAETVEACLLERPGLRNRRAQIVCRARQALASIARGKLEAGLARVSPDGRLRDSHRYYGAHTGRWSGRGMQLQNMPRPDGRFESWGDAEICALADQVLAGRHWATAAEIDLLLRACLVAGAGYTLAVCDFSGVEARGLAWVAGDQEALDVFAGTKDAYKLMAAVIFGVPYESIGKDERRQVGKVAELACGYGMGHVKFEDTALKAGVRLTDVGVEPRAVVNAWRQRHAPVVRFWKQLERAFCAAVQGGEATAANLRLMPSYDGADVALFLPSGRPIVYNDTRIGSDGYGRPQASFHGTKAREHTYGGKLTENAIQALCRDLMADALVRAEQCGLRPVLHVHDEIVCEVPAGAGAEGLAVLHEIMTTLPEWAQGFPIGAAGHHGKRYRK